MTNIKFSIFFIFITINSFCQTKPNNTPKDVDSLLNKYLQERKLDSLAELAYKTSVHYYRKYNFKKAIKYSSIEVNARRKLDDTIRYKKSVFNKGLFLYKNKQYYKSLHTYQIVIDSFEIDKRTYRTYCKIGDIYKQLSDYYYADNYYQKGLSKISVFNDKELLRLYINYAIVCDKIKTTESLKKELYLLIKADSLSNNLKLSDRDFYSLNYSLASYHQTESVFDFNKSKYYYNKVLTKAANKNDTITSLKVYNNMSDLYTKVNNDSAYYFMKTGISLSKNKKLSLVKFNYRFSKYNYKNNSLEQALKNVNTSLKLITNNDEENFLNVENAITNNNKREFLLLLKHKAAIYIKLYDIKEDKKTLDLSLKYLQLSDKLIDLIKQENIENQSKLFWQKQASEVYFNAVKVCKLLNKDEEAFYFIEKNKALLLLENISESQIRKQANIPVEILEEEFELKQKINRLENQLNKDNSNKDSIKDKYYTTKIALGDFIKSLKSSYPEYHNYKKPIEIVKLNEIQKSLDKQTMVLEYLINEEGGFILAVTKNATKLHEIDSIKKFNSTVETYISNISKPINTTFDATNYQTVAHKLFQSLIPFEKDKGINKLIVIPDYTLQNIPFEALLTSTNKDSYLIKDYEVSYAYSLSFLEKNNQKQKDKKTSNEFIGVAPTNFTYDNLSSLNNSKKEVLEANSNYTGLMLLDSLATKSNFISEVKDYNIIHLATHANANDSIAPWIAFYDQKMYLNEVHTLKNNAELVVLSACKSSLGEINPGEGVFSLARGFFHAGSKSVISSLWNVNDKSTQEILNDFYTNLKKGKTKSEALREAKLKYLSAHQLSELSPYYWSSIVLIGDVNALPSTSLYTYLILGILIILSIFLFKKFKKYIFLGNKI